MRDTVQYPAIPAYVCNASPETLGVEVSTREHTANLNFDLVSGPDDPVRRNRQARRIARRLAAVETEAFVRMIIGRGIPMSGQGIGQEVYGNLEPALLNMMFRLIEQHDLLVTAVVIHSGDVPEFTKRFSASHIDRAPSSKYPLVGHLWTSDILCSDAPSLAGHAMCFAAPDYVGACPIRSDVELKFKSDKGQVRVQASSDIGMIIMNDFATSWATYKME